MHMSGPPPVLPPGCPPRLLRGAARASGLLSRWRTQLDGLLRLRKWHQALGPDARAGSCSRSGEDATAAPRY
eukprot:362836-Chlamydomonas_euryale.AAC.10